MYSSTAICEQLRLDPNQEIILDDNTFARHGYTHKASIQGSAKGGNVEVKIKYANHSKLAFKDFETITFSDGVDLWKELTNLPICRHFQYVIKNTSANVVYFTLVPVFI